MVHTDVLVDVNVSGFTAPPFIMGCAARDPLLALSCGMGLCLSTILFAEFTVLVLGRPRKILTGDLVLLGAPAAFGVGSRFASSRATLRIIGRTTFAVVIGLMFV